MHNPLPKPDIAVPAGRRLLFAFLPWRPITGNPWAGWLEYRTNPRDAEYMLNLASEFNKTHATGTTADLMTDAMPAAVMEKHKAWLVRVIGTKEIVAPDCYDTIVLLYPDAIGLQYHALEQRLLTMKARQYLVLNGRRRIFVWDDASRRALAWRRFLTSWRVPERLLVAAGVMALACLAGWDWGRERSAAKPSHQRRILFYRR